MHTKVRLERIRINSQGYDASGAYWGVGQPVWHAWADGDNGFELEMHYRALDRDAAKAKVIAQCPNATFFR